MINILNKIKIYTIQQSVRAWARITMEEEKMTVEMSTMKEKVILYLNKELTDDEIKNFYFCKPFNPTNQTNSNWNEEDIKLYYLTYYCGLFNDEEYEFYFNKIKSAQKSIK